MKKEKKNGHIHLLNCSILSGSTQHIKPQFSRETTESVRQPVAFSGRVLAPVWFWIQAHCMCSCRKESGTYSTSCRLLWVHHHRTQTPPLHFSFCILQTTECNTVWFLSLPLHGKLLKIGHRT